MADQIFERLEQHISDFGLDNFTYKDGNIANLGDVTTAFANSLSALLPDGFEVDLTEAKTITAELVRSDARKTADESVSDVIDQFTSEQWCSLQAPEYKSRILQESMGNFSDAITSEQKENYYKMYNNLKLEEKELFLTDFLTYSSEETDFQIQFNRTFDKAMQLFQLKKERQLALKEFPKPSSIMDQKKKRAFIPKRKAFFNSATLEDYKTFNRLDDPEKKKVLTRFSNFKLRKSRNQVVPSGLTFNQIMSGTYNSRNQR